MNTRNLVLGSAMLLPLFYAKPAQAQVSADIIIGGGPISGRVIIGDQGRYHGRPRPIGRMEWVRARDYRRDDWFRDFDRGSRIVVVYYDRDDDCYYFDRYRSGLEEIQIFVRDGHYYRLEGDGYGDPRYYRGYGNSRSYPRYVVPRYDQRYQQPRYDQRYQRPRYDSRNDGRYDNRRGDDRRDDWRDNRRDGKNKKDHRDNRRDGRQDHRGN